MFYQGLVTGDYVIEDELGRGGFGSVFLARHQKTGQDVAIKFLHPKLLQDPHSRQAFLDEMINQARLSLCPNIVRVHQSISHVDRQGEHLGMVMEFVDGEPLDLWIERYGLLPHFVAIPLFVQVLLGVGFAHGIGMLHRDLKPGNLLIAREGMVKVMDFGLSKMIQGAAGVAAESARAASLNYVAPERLMKQDLDARSDIYSLGATFYESLTGRPPYELAFGDWEKALTAHSSGQIQPVEAFCDSHPAGLTGLVMKALHPDPNQRYASCGEMLQDLLHLGSDLMTVPAGAEPWFASVARQTASLLAGEGEGRIYTGGQAMQGREDLQRVNRAEEEERLRQAEAAQKKAEASESVDRLLAAGQYAEALDVLERFFDASEEFAAHRLALLKAWKERTELYGKAEAGGAYRDALAHMATLLEDIPEGEGRVELLRRRDALEKRRKSEVLQYQGDLEGALPRERLKLLKKLVLADLPAKVEGWKAQLERETLALEARNKRKIILALSGAGVLLAAVLVGVFWLPGHLLQTRMDHIEALMATDPAQELTEARELLRQKDTPRIRALHEQILASTREVEGQKMLQEGAGLEKLHRWDEALAVLASIRREVYQGGTLPERFRKEEDGLRQRAHDWYLKLFSGEGDRLQRYRALDSALSFQERAQTRRLRDSWRLQYRDELVKALFVGLDQAGEQEARTRIRLLMDLAPSDGRVLRAREQVRRRYPAG